ncbi:unnamed protein product [Camellia sinensis]
MWDTKSQAKNCGKIIIRIGGRRLYTSWELIRRVSIYAFANLEIHRLLCGSPQLGRLEFF